MAEPYLYPLNKSRRSWERYYLCAGRMGCHGMPEGHPNYTLQVVNGVDRGNGFQGYASCSYALTKDSMPADAKAKLRAELVRRGFAVFLPAE